MQPERTKKELMNLARKRGIKGYSAMSKAQLEEAIAELEAISPARASRGTKSQEALATAAVKAEATIPAAETPTPAQAQVEAQKVEAAIIGHAHDTEELTVEVAAAAGPVASVAIMDQVPALEIEAVSTEASNEPGDELSSPADEAAAILDTEATVSDEALPTSGEPVVTLKRTWTNHELLIDETLPELPVQYATDRIVLMVRDPFWSYAYWDLSAASVNRARAQGGRQLALRVHDVTGIAFGKSPSNLTYDLRMPFDGQRQWYLNMPSDGRSYVVQVGYLRSDESFVAIATSNVGSNPISRPSAVVSDRFASLSYSAPLPGSNPPAPASAATRKEGENVVGGPVWPAGPAKLSDVEAPRIPDWNVQDDERIHATGLDGADPGPWSARFPKFGDLGRPPQTLSSHALSSWAMAPSSAQHGGPSPTAQVPGKDFWLVANCELIVYGATEPDATLTLRGEVIPLREDGTFTLRFELPDGLHPIPIKAVNRDGDMERNISFTVSRATTVGPSR